VQNTDGVAGASQAKATGASGYQKSAWTLLRVCAVTLLLGLVFFGGLRWIELHPVCEYGSCECSAADGGSP
jgi:hypothetical protein